VEEGRKKAGKWGNGFQSTNLIKEEWSGHIRLEAKGGKMRSNSMKKKWILATKFFVVLQAPSFSPIPSLSSLPLLHFGVLNTKFEMSSTPSATGTSLSTSSSSSSSTQNTFSGVEIEFMAEDTLIEIRLTADVKALQFLEVLPFLFYFTATLSVRFSNL
jgi:hypothetical protein